MKMRRKILLTALRPACHCPGRRVGRACMWPDCTSSWNRAYIKRVNKPPPLQCTKAEPQRTMTQISSSWNWAFIKRVNKPLQCPNAGPQQIMRQMNTTHAGTDDMNLAVKLHLLVEYCVIPPPPDYKWLDIKMSPSLSCLVRWVKPSLPCLVRWVKPSLPCLVRWVKPSLPCLSDWRSPRYPACQIGEALATLPVRLVKPSLPCLVREAGCARQRYHLNYSRCNHNKV